MVTQRVLWIPESRVVKSPTKERPTRLWTLYLECDEAKSPALPIRPAHMVNAFLEDFVHDWNIWRGDLRYYSRAMDHSVWVLLEYGKADG